MNREPIHPIDGSELSMSEIRNTAKIGATLFLLFFLGGKKKKRQ